MSRILIISGIVLIVVGLLSRYLDTSSTKGVLQYFGKLPGDFSIKGEGYRFFFPLTTSILISVIISGLFWVFRAFLK